MAEKKTYWLGDGYGNAAFVEGAAERDRWVPRGWSEADEPSGTEMVWMHHPQTGGRQRFAAGVIEQWVALGWEPSAPPEPVDVLHDAQLVDIAPVPGGPAAESTTNTETAASGNAKGK
ncbi:hypothetical protein O7602_26690 [Micromonospora sp. WMMD1128]|uniref:hypothetical protein n=1 Tax=Micromonospora sp. WMMD1128 TaxID=3015150 RepID=UPI00248C18F4|nr:hypothetical protein [Micromonospora sp. WMMD1128]WBB73232.1 hypothetical protein O7602_26690 [Micromonospora sp. WMMD1128]